ncbi:MAG: ADP-ribosylglycohydrolase family protein [Isosphaeraceae bacterium]
MVLADVILRRGQIDRHAVAEQYVRMASPRGEFLGAHRAAGRSFRLVVQDLERGVSPEETGQDSAGIGAAVRVPPLAIYHHARSGDGGAGSLDRDVIAASLMTHRDFRSLAGALAIAAACKRLLAAEDRSPSLLFRVAGDLIRSEDTLGEQGLDKLVGYGRYRRNLSNANRPGRSNPR